MSIKFPIILFLVTSVYSCSLNVEQVQQHLLSAAPSLDPDSLKTNIIVANDVWKQRTWSKDYEYDMFLNYILPPRIADEPTEYYWRTDIPRWLDIEYHGNNLLELSQMVNSKINVDTRREDWGNKHMGYTATMAGVFGKCDDRAILATMAMRSMGIPAAFEIIPMWGGNNNGHSCCSVIASDNSIFTFQGTNDNGIETRFCDKVPKVYRRLFFEDTTLPTYQFQDTEDIPELFADFRLKDVTYLHKVGQRDISIKSTICTDNHLCYLSVFHPNGWFPIAYGLIDNKNLIFRDIGIGTDADGHAAVGGENIGNGILYLPTIYENGNIPVANPFIVKEDEIKILQPMDETETITLHRKYPKLDRISGFADRMIGGVIEIANKADFSDADQIHHIYEQPLSRVQKIILKQHKRFRYIRYRKSSGTLSIAELIAYDKNGQIISGNTIACETLQKDPEIMKIRDNNPLTFIEIPNGLDLWVGLDLGRHENISSIGFCPRNDDNDISPGDIYELFYWDGEWKSLGEKKACTHELNYHNVPKNALLWLRDKSKGKEERPFTYEHNTQIWW